MFAQTPSGGDWSWLHELQRSYHSWSQSSLSTWLGKATKASNQPPKAKHVRRILVASLRDPEVTPFHVARALVSEVKWKSDARIAAKCLYIVLLLLQYQDNIEDVEGIVKFANTIVSYWNDHVPPDKQQIYCSIATRIGAIIHSKAVFHMNHAGVRGNFAVKKNVNLQELIQDLRQHLVKTHYETSGVQAAVSASDDFTATVLWQPMIEEAVSAYRLLKSIDRSNESDSIFQGMEELIQRLPDFPYIASTVIFPVEGEKVTIPRERFPKKV